MKIRAYKANLNIKFSFYYKIIYKKGVFKMNRIGDIVVSFLIGVAVGSMIGILYAPSSGEETRKLIKEKTTETLEEANKQLQKLNTELKHLKEEGDKFINDLKEKLSKKTAETKNE
jgi:gas vesicle protein